MTVAELVAELQKRPQDKQIGILDADTFWWGPIIHIGEDDKTVILSIQYDEMES